MAKSGLVLSVAVSAAFLAMVVLPLGCGIILVGTAYMPPELQHRPANELAELNIDLFVTRMRINGENPRGVKIFLLPGTYTLTYHGPEGPRVYFMSPDLPSSQPFFLIVVGEKQAVSKQVTLVAGEAYRLSRLATPFKEVLINLRRGMPLREVFSDEVFSDGPPDSMSRIKLRGIGHFTSTTSGSTTEVRLSFQTSENEPANQYRVLRLNFTSQTQRPFTLDSWVYRR